MSTTLAMRLVWVVFGASCVVSSTLAKDAASCPGSSSDPTRDFSAFRAAFVQQLSVSPKPRDRLLATRLDYEGVGWLAKPADSKTRNALLREAAHSAPDDFMLQWEWSGYASDPSVCGTGPACQARIEAASRLQPENSAAWIPVLNAAVRSHDTSRVDATLARMATADRYEEPDGIYIKAWFDAVDRHPPPPSIKMPDDQCKVPDARLELIDEGISDIEVGVPDYTGLFRACQTEVSPQDRSRRAGSCARIGRLMMHSGAMVARLYGRRLLGGSGLATANDLPQARIVLWELQNQNVGNVPSRECGAVEPIRLLISDWQASNHGIDVLHRRMLRAGVPLEPPANWRPSKDGKAIDPLDVDAW